MDRGIPTEAVLAELRRPDAQVFYLVGTPPGRLTALEPERAQKPWRQVRPQLRVKLLPREGEVYVLAQSGAPTDKKRALRRRQLKTLWQRLGPIQKQDLPRDPRLEKVGAARDRAGRAGAGSGQATVAADGHLVFALERPKSRAVRRREGRYPLRTHWSAEDPE